jgi:hypothetical protein
MVFLSAMPAAAGLQAGVGRASITPLEKDLPTQLGGYGARNGAPAEGIHDTIWAKALVFDFDGKKSALVSLDVCSVPVCLVEESLAKANIEGLSPETVLMAASHSHAGIEGFSLDRRNIAGNPHIGIFDREVLDFTSARIAKALQDANAALQPVTAGSGVVALEGMNRNRRGDGVIDEDLTVLRIDDAKGKPVAVLVNFTAHGTIMTEKEMLISGGWAGNMQRTVEALFGEGVTCLYTNGAEGDISPAGAQGGSRWEMAEDYGRRVGMAAAEVAGNINPKRVESFEFRCRWVELPPRKAAPNFVEITGAEYHVTQEQLDALLQGMLPGRAPFYALRVNGFGLVSIPGEPICAIGLATKDSMSKGGVAHPCVAGLSGDYIGYILSKDIYNSGGYEATTSFYGDGLGDLVREEAVALAKAAATK